MLVDGVSHTQLNHIDEFRNRWSYSRPTMIALAENKGAWFYVPNTNNTQRYWLPKGTDGIDYLILSDHNRSPVTINTTRIGTSNRMIDASMRSYFVADKMTLTFNWDTLPSRAFATLGGYDEWVATGKDHLTKITADGGAGGTEMLDWYNRHKGAMWVFMSYDSGFGNKDASSDKVIFTGYSKVFEAQITSFEHEVTKRTPQLSSQHGNLYQFDFWNVSISLEEV